ncbi:hypothetical protein PC116_g7732 [Phytophthora cactorum]|nr:hypothetical protein PC117_g21577 [Phytophthora cactorum]KAG2923274.1 hypothetical protein PC114_g4885 [Phytophthora cactorum]KAG3031274.1 hypothetical protein PC120_g3256 [Phytophthora cactorum]KAG3135343.1 hypothetical protein C6341_g21806 [Phytophthora cactorum]KAG3199270.1 hypothetical protein PC128_g5382 [Phytophthora cactorum]
MPPPNPRLVSPVSSRDNATRTSRAGQRHAPESAVSEQLPPDAVLSGPPTLREHRVVGVHVVAENVVIGEDDLNINVLEEAPVLLGAIAADATHNEAHAAVAPEADDAEAEVPVPEAFQPSGPDREASDTDQVHMICGDGRSNRDASEPAVDSEPLEGEGVSAIDLNLRRSGRVKDVSRQRCGHQ